VTAPPLTPTGRLVQISVSRGGLPKRPVESARITAVGVEGDAHRDTRHHGGPERAVCLYTMEAIDALQAEGHRCEPGFLGENLTVEGLDWGAVAPGTRFRVGSDVLLEVTRYTSPCLNLAGVFIDGDYARVSQKRHPGWSRVYARVVTEGVARRGDAVAVLPPTDADAVPSSRRRP
jgi:MOSC domain-containing protein YiiM